MSDAFTTITVVRLYLQEEFARIVAGVIPREMEDKWFIFYENPWLYLHRSWTGYCIFKVRFEVVLEGVKIAEVQVNRDPAKHYSNIDDERDVALLGLLLDSQAQRNMRRGEESTNN